MLQMFDVLLNEWLEDHTCEWRQCHEQLLVVSVDVAIRIFYAKHNALGLILDLRVLHNASFLQSLQDLPGCLIGQVGQHHLYGQRIAIEKLHEPLELFAPEVGIALLAIKHKPLHHPLGQGSRSLTVQPGQSIDIVLPHWCLFTLRQPILGAA